MGEAVSDQIELELGWEDEQEEKRRRRTEEKKDGLSGLQKAGWDKVIYSVRCMVLVPVRGSKLWDCLVKKQKQVPPGQHKLQGLPIRSQWG